MVHNPIILHDNVRSHTAAASWTSCADGNGTLWNIHHTHPVWVHAINDIFTKVKEPLRGTRYSTRNEIIRVIGRSVLNMDKYGRADGLRRLSNYDDDKFVRIKYETFKSALNTDLCDLPTSWSGRGLDFQGLKSILTRVSSKFCWVRTLLGYDFILLNTEPICLHFLSILQRTTLTAY